MSQVDTATSTVAPSAEDASTQATREQPKQLSAETQTQSKSVADTQTTDQTTQSKSAPRRRDRSNRQRRDAKPKSTARVTDKVNKS